MSIRRIAAVAGLAAALSLTGVSPAAAAPTCADFEGLDVEVHGQHVVRDYVAGGSAGTTWPPSDGVRASGGAAIPGGPGPGFHFEHGIAPGASFCLPQSNSPGFHQGDHDH